MTTNGNPTPHLYALENWGGEWAVAYYQDHGDGRLVPQQDWTPISRAEAANIIADNLKFVRSHHYGVTFYDLNAQIAAASDDDWADAMAELRDRNQQGVSAGYGEL